MISPESTERLFVSITQITFGIWIIIISLAWLTGIAVQGVGEITGIIRYFPKCRNKDKKERIELEEWIKYYNAFLKCASPSERQLNERYAVIKESCGNGFVALVLSVILIIRDNFNLVTLLASHNNFLRWFHYRFLPLSPILILVLFFIITLCIKHFRHVNRQYLHMVECLEAYKKKDNWCCMY